MKIIQFNIYLLMMFQTTESLTDIQVTLGANVTLTCGLDIKEIYWYKWKLPDPPELILRTYQRTYEGAKYENSNSEHKYSVKSNSRLFISNISTDELGVYYCVKTSEPLKFSNGTKIYISDFIQKNISDSVHRNQTESNKCLPQWNILITSSVLLNVILAIAVIGLLKSCIDAKSRSKNTSDEPQSITAAQNTNELQYAEVDFAKRPRRKNPSQDQSTLYSAIQPVKRA